jgi:hypothetical protein
MVCEKMSWTYEEYEKQPDWFIQTLLLKWSLENQQQKQDARQSITNSN